MSDLVPRPSDEIEEVAIPRDQALAAYEAAQDLMLDFQQALRLIQKYQRNLDMLGAPDPDIVDSRNLLKKHGIHVERMQPFRIFANGVDITEHPDSIQGTASDVVEGVLDYDEPPQLEQGTND